MHAKAQARYNTRQTRGYSRPPIRARLGLAMRRDMDFGPLGDIGDVLRAEGLTLAPMSTGDTSMMVGGITVLPAADVKDIDSGAVRGLVLPGGRSDAESDRAARQLIDTARAKGAPILALGSAVPEVLNAAGRDPAKFAQAPAVLMNEDDVTVLADHDALVAATARIC